MNTRFGTFVLTAAIALLGAGQSQADTTLRMSHFWPGGSTTDKEIFQAWAQAVTEQSGGELRVQDFPSQTLSKADDTYDATVRGITDIGVTAQGYTAGRFPLSQIAELPGVIDNASQGACVMQTLYDEGRFGDEYKDTHVLFMFTTGPGYIHTREKDVQTPADLKGLRIRRPTAVAGDMLESMGARPVGMPAPDIYTSMQRGVLDGLSFPWEGMKVFRLNELTHYHTQVPFYAVVFVATMNKQAYERLTDSERAVIDANSGMTWANNAGAVFSRLDAAGRQEAEAAGDTIRVIDHPLDNPDWQGPLKQGIEHYLSGLESRGLDQGREVYQAALKARSACDAQAS